MTSTYHPNNSPFGDAYSDWIVEGDYTLQVYSGVELAEFASCAASLLNTPVYADDESLAEFAKALDWAVNA